VSKETKRMIKVKILYPSLKSLGSSILILGAVAVYKGIGLHDLWVRFIEKII
jgi:hypothetical protein